MGPVRTPDADRETGFLGEPPGVRPVRKPPVRSATDEPRGAATIQRAERVEPDAPRATDRRLGLIICAGMPRAGSTLQYNIVRLLAERYLGARAGGWYADFDSFAAEHPDYSDVALARQGSAVQRPPLVIKLHGFDARFAALVDPPACGHVFHIYRDLRDALISYTRKFGGTMEQNIETWTARWVELNEQWSSLQNVTVSRYEEVNFDPAIEVRRCAAVLGIAVADAAIGAVVDACSSAQMKRLAERGESPVGGIAKDFLIHSNHLADGSWGQWQRVMPAAQRGRVWYIAGPWLERHGYPRHKQHGEAALAAIRSRPPVDDQAGGVPLLRASDDFLVRALCDAVEGPLQATRAPAHQEPARARVFYGDSLEVISGDVVSAELLTRGHYEEGLSWALLRCLRPGDTFIDVGAHIGYYAMLAARLVGSEGQVVAFEPTPATREVLERNARQAANVSVRGEAVFSRSGRVTLRDHGPGHAAFNSLCPTRMEDCQEPMEVRELAVEAVTLDEFCASQRMRPDFVKIDVENAELDVLRGATEMLKTAQPIVSVEVGDIGEAGSTGALLRFAGSLGYEAWEYVSGGRFAPHIERSTYRYDNVILLPAGRCRRRGGEGGQKDDPQRILADLIREHAWAVAHEREPRRSLLARNRELSAQVENWQALWKRQMTADARLHAGYVRRVWDRLGEQYEAVVLFGAGRYAKWLLEAVVEQAARPHVIRLLDDSAPIGSTKAKLPVVRPCAEALRGGDAVIVATDDPASPLWARCADVCKGLPIINLYERIGTGPFPTDSWIDALPCTACR